MSRPHVQKTADSDDWFVPDSHCVAPELNGEQRLGPSKVGGILLVAGFGVTPVLPKRSKRSMLLKIKLYASFACVNRQSQ